MDSSNHMNPIDTPASPKFNFIHETTICASNFECALLIYILSGMNMNMSRKPVM